jgi:translation initiation factor 2B subunit (eIF-2B alpha/beta/delta family)
MQLCEYTDKDGNTEIRNQYGDVIPKEAIDEFITSCTEISKSLDEIDSRWDKLHSMLMDEVAKNHANK